MRKKQSSIPLLVAFILSILITPVANLQAEDQFVDVSIDGKEYKFSSDDFFTTFNSFGKNDSEFKIFVGKDTGPQLVVTIPADMTTPVKVPSGSTEPGNKIYQGSVSLQDYPEKGDTYNNYDGTANPRPEVIPDAVVISSVKNISDKKRQFEGAINTKTTNGNLIVAKFSIQHEF